MTIDAAIAAMPGVAQQRSTFAQIIGVTVIVGLVVVALFFALIVVERTSLYGVLKAMGARRTALVGGVVAQAVAVSLLAAASAPGSPLRWPPPCPPVPSPSPCRRGG